MLRGKTPPSIRLESSGRRRPRHGLRSHGEGRVAIDKGLVYLLGPAIQTGLLDLVAGVHLVEYEIRILAGDGLDGVGKQDIWTLFLCTQAPDAR